MQKVMPFTCIKKHFEGEIFAPIEINGAYQLQSANFVLVGARGNAYEFKSFANAHAWIESNLIRASKVALTKQIVIDRLIVANSTTPSDFLQLEIDTLQAKNNGDWIDDFIDGGTAAG